MHFAEQRLYFFNSIDRLVKLARYTGRAISTVYRSRFAAIRMA